MTNVTQYQGIAYFDRRPDALAYGERWARDWQAPQWRIVAYTRGYAVQLRPGGDYFGADGVPSMETAMRRMFA